MHINIFREILEKPPGTDRQKWEDDIEIDTSDVGR
jgi:hypothetical protein